MDRAGALDFKFERLAAVTNASGFVVQYAYDIMDRVTNISWRTSNGATLGGFAYEYDAAGNRMTRTEDGETITYTLGVGDRLAS